MSDPQPRPFDHEHNVFVFTTKRPVAVTMMVIAVVVFGLVGLRRLPVNLLPDLSYPTVTVRTQYPGAGPEDVEERVSERIQEAVSVVPGVRRVVSISRPEVSDVVLDFEWGTSMVFAVSDVRERLDRVTLPRETEQPLVLRYDPSLDPVMTFGLRGELPSIELRRIAEEEIERELGKLEGIAAVKVRGGEEDEIRIDVDEAALSVLGLDVARLGERLAAENVNSASGSIDEGRTEFLVRTLGEFRNLDEIADVIIERRGDAPVRLRDVARVHRIPKDRDVISRIDGAPCVLIDVYKEAGANVVALAARVRDRAFGTAAQQAYVKALPADGSPPPATTRPGASEMETRMAELRRAARHREMQDFLARQLGGSGVSLTLLQDQSTFIESAIRDVQDSAVQGGLLAILIIFLFLRRLGPTLVLAISIPISLVASFAPMFLSGVTLNVMSLGGLALGVGMLVDNSIVVLEAITREREQGRGIRAAAVAGVSRVAGAVTSSTLTTVAVFFPIVFVEGIAGQLFRDQSLTVVYSLLMSLVVALLVIPMLMTRRDRDGWFQREPQPPASRIGRFLQRSTLRVSTGLAGLSRGIAKLCGLLVWPLLWAFDRVWRVADAVYPRALGLALRWRATIILAALALGAVAGFAARGLDTDMVPEVAQGEFTVNLFLPRDATVERTDRVAAPIELAIAAMPEVEDTFLAVGVDDDELNDASEGEHSAKILVRLKRTVDLAAAENTVRERILAQFGRLPELAEPPQFESPNVLAFSAPLAIEVVGEDLVALREVSGAIETRLAALPELRDVRSSQQRGNPEIVLRLDRDRMSALGIDSGSVSRILETKVKGLVATRFAEQDRRIDMRVAVAREEIDRLQALLDINVNPKGEPAIPLEAVGEVRVLEGPSEIRRIGNTRGAEIRASVRGLGVGNAQERVALEAQSVVRPPGIEVRLGAQQQEMAASMQSVLLALALAVFLVYVVMASQFESLLQPFIILCTVPLAAIGVVFVLLATGTPVSVIVMLGCIVLAGIVVNNAIIMIDQINQLRAEGMAKGEAIVTGAASRLRPVLMTTLTTVLGLLPMTGWFTGIPLLGSGAEGIELRAPLAITVVSGLCASTLLTLFVIPCVYSFADRRA
ncbi:MAG: efflux RND transporter permease subunit [Planctomycetes bacterium]|nr:efflux RND transporter permease subunit [Planctomycetota bacterium]